MTIDERIQALWAITKARPMVERPREPASPHGTYPNRVPRRCTECGSREIVKDGRYWCREHHPDFAETTTDVVVTVPKRLWDLWIDEGDLPGDEPSGEEWDFSLGGSPPLIAPGDRVYVVAHGKLRGYAPLTRIASNGGNSFSLIRRGGAVACTIDEPIPGFRGWRYVWWRRSDERPFPAWRMP